MNTIFTQRCPLLKTVLSLRQAFEYANVKKMLSNKSNCFSTGHFPIDNINALKKDIVLFTLEKSKLFRYTSIFGVTQFGICAYLGGNMFISLKDTGHNRVSDNENSGIQSWRSINFGDMKYRIIAGLSCISIGFLTAYISYTLPTRIIKELTLCKGGKVASIVMHGPFGRTSQFQVPLQHMSCMVSRPQAKSYIPLKVKNKWFFYLMDCKGQFRHPQLFDLTVGARSWGH